MPLSCPSIIVPVFNAFEHLQLCLESLARTVPDNTKIILIDDASTDKRVRPFLESWVGQAETYRQLLTHEENQGFVVTANRGMQFVDNDVILLNSDTQVSDGWLQRISVCLNSNPSIATVTPWSNNGEIVSIPAFCQANKAPDKPDAVASVIAACGKASYPELPTAVGFCMAVSLRAIKIVGLFDEATFGHGYGEENDFCERVVTAGMTNVLCDDAYVVHHGGASFGPLGLKPDENSMQRLLSKHPGYQNKVSEFIRLDPLAPRRQEILDCLQRSGIRML